MAFACTLASGSSGNASVISDGESSVLLDAGISAKRLFAGFSDCRIDTATLCGIVITHEHLDHIAGLRVFAKKTGVAVYASRGTCAAIAEGLPELRTQLRYVDAGEPFDVGGIRLKAFKTPHDARESFGYTLNVRGRQIAFATDLGDADEATAGLLEQAEILFIEANYDIDTLRRLSTYPVWLKRRVHGHSGHLSNDSCARVVARCVRAGAKYVRLLHISEENNSPDLAEGTVISVLYESGLHGGVSVEAAPRHNSGRPVCL